MDDDERLVAELMASLNEIDEVYFEENFDSLLHVMDLLAKDEPEVAKDAIKAQLEAATRPLSAARPRPAAVALAAPPPPGPACQCPGPA